MSNKYLVIITAENKEKYISDTIESCLNQKFTKSLRIIVVYSRLANEISLKRRFRNDKNIVFLNCLIKKKLPIQDQLFKIEKASTYIQNEWVLLLDGDDLFKPNKIVNLNKLNLNKEKLYLNDHMIINKNLLIKKPERKKYKQLNIYKKFFNDWPEKVNTSSIVIHGELLKKFYKTNNPYNWKFLAIDIQLVLLYHYRKKLVFVNKILTSKRENINNLDKKFSNYFRKIYWLRRYEQHNLTRKISKKLNLIDRFITIIFIKILK